MGSKASTSSGRQETVKLVLFDIDGVLACNLHRLPHIHDDRDNPDWEAFYKEIENDPLLPGWASLAKLLHPEHVIVMLTNRPERFREATVRWLSKHFIPWDDLRMRDGAHYNDSKRQHVAELRAAGHDIALAIDDDPHHELMYTELGIPFVYAHSGYYDRGRLDDDKIVTA